MELHIHSYVSSNKIFNLRKTETADVGNKILSPAKCDKINQWPTGTVLTKPLNVYTKILLTMTNSNQWHWKSANTEINGNVNDSIKPHSPRCSLHLPRIWDLDHLLTNICETSVRFIVLKEEVNWKRKEGRRLHDSFILGVPGSATLSKSQCWLSSFGVISSASVTISDFMTSTVWTWPPELMTKSTDSQFLADVRRCWMSVYVFTAGKFLSAIVFWLPCLFLIKGQTEMGLYNKLTTVQGV